MFRGGGGAKGADFVGQCPVPEFEEKKEDKKGKGKKRGWKWIRRGKNWRKFANFPIIWPIYDL